MATTGRRRAVRLHPVSTLEWTATPGAAYDSSTSAARPMRRLLRLAASCGTLALFLLSPLTVRAQTGDAARYWITVGTEGGADSAPTPRSVARRALRGSEHAPRYPDRGLNPDALAALAALGVDVRHTSRWLGAVSADLTPAQAAAVAGVPGVRSVRRTARLVAHTVAQGVPLDAPAASSVFVYGPSEAQLAFVRADETIEAGRTAAGVLFGILDTRFDFGHPALAHIPAAGHLVAEQNFVGGDQSNFHGLACSSIALGRLDGQLVGPAHDARVLAATTEFAPTETHAEEDAFVAGLEWMEAQGVDVVSVSLGYSRFDAGEGDYTPADMDGNTAVVTRAADIAASLGVAVVVAAGNEGNDAWAIITAPADADSVITVGAAASDGTRAGFSGVGPTADGRTKPDVAALGVNVYVAEPGGGEQFGSGTSYAAPMVAGVVAQMLGARPNLTPTGVREALRSTASQASAPDNALGWGVVDAVAALAASTASDPAPGEEPVWTLAPTVARAGRTLTLGVGDADAGTVDLVDALGRRVATWSVPAGAVRVTLAVPDVPPGAYFVRVPDAAALRLTVVR